MKARLTLTLALLLICTGAALAQTPDEETPAEETVCDGESGAAYGLCNAYCEAMDCESDDPQASETACTRVKDKYTQITGHGLPCEVADCPCSAIPEWIAALASGPTGCDQSPDRLELSTSSGFVVLVTEGFCAVFEPPGAGSALPVTPAERAACLDLLTPLCVAR